MTLSFQVFCRLLMSSDVMASHEALLGLLYMTVPCLQCQRERNNLEEVYPILRIVYAKKDSPIKLMRMKWNSLDFLSFGHKK